MKTTSFIMAAILAVMFSRSGAFAGGCGEQDCFDTNAKATLDQGIWANDGSIAAWQDSRQKIDGAVNCRPLEISVSTLGFTEIKNQLITPNLTLKQTGNQLVDVTLSGNTNKDGGEIKAKVKNQQNSFTNTALTDNGLETMSSDFQKTRGWGWSDNGRIEVQVGIHDQTEYNAVATRDGWNAEHSGFREQHIEADGSGRGLLFKAEQTGSGFTNTTFGKNSVSSSLNQNTTTKVKTTGPVDVTATQNRVDNFNQTLEKPGFKGTQSGSAISATSVTIKKGR